jgi:hypothetical protein
MKCIQIEAALIPRTNTILSTPHGKVVRRNDNSKLIMKVKPTGFLLNSTLVGDIINRRDVLVIDIEKGTLYSIPGDTVVREVLGEFQWSES